jgi:hypothetical protein
MVRYCESSNLEEPINSERVVAPGSRCYGQTQSDTTDARRGNAGFGRR